ncbi:hypothetical protein [Desulfoferrobacter suflitae]|uniref:hypothetical protein n=1 Tax=Desulfoferrobacter suflitae TaxID=2865782 RepID=UPI002164AF1B|nr:hypothetical protein [Desulfoferrobacter suflitae]MCK8601165.1 hypothetical protein [Desulfoferrobacter suflitae]
MTKVKPSTLRLGIVEMGRLGEIALRVVAANLQAVLGIEVDFLGPHEVPENAYQAHRQQFDAGLILKHLSGCAFPKYPRILALTNLDLCIPILTYVFGEAEMGGRAAVVSGFRLRHNEDGTAVSIDRYYERLAKVALHEVAHTLSLYHCEESLCLMHFSSKVGQLDKLHILFCERCAFMLQTSLRNLAEEFASRHRKKPVKSDKQKAREARPGPSLRS